MWYIINGLQKYEHIYVASVTLIYFALICADHYKWQVQECGAQSFVETGRRASYLSRMFFGYGRSPETIWAD